MNSGDIVILKKMPKDNDSGVTKATKIGSLYTVSRVYRTPVFTLDNRDSWIYDVGLEEVGANSNYYTYFCDLEDLEIVFTT